jgi:predicted neutral ceramidase superfamily lipid hydrolase
MRAFCGQAGGADPLALVVSDVHPGPFRTVGSSMLPSLIQQKLGEKGFEAAVLKGLSSHEKNIASRKTTEQLAERLAAEAHALLESNVFEDSFMTPMRKKLNGASALTVGIAGKRIIILTLHPHPMEDLSPEAPSRHDSRRHLGCGTHTTASTTGSKPWKTAPLRSSGSL